MMTWRRSVVGMVMAAGLFLLASWGLSWAEEEDVSDGIPIERPAGPEEMCQEEVD